MRITITYMLSPHNPLHPPTHICTFLFPYQPHCDIYGYAKFYSIAHIYFKVFSCDIKTSELTYKLILCRQELGFLITSDHRKLGFLFTSDHRVLFCLRYDNCRIRYDLRHFNRCNIIGYAIYCQNRFPTFNLDISSLIFISQESNLE